MTKQEAIDRLLAWCAAQVGYREGANNDNKYTDDPLLRQLLGWYPQDEPWCDIFTDEAFLQCFGLQAASEMTYQPIGKGSALCRTSAQYFKAHNAFVQTPEPGDVIFFNVSGGINHQGIVEKVSGGTVTTIEGNSSDAVARHSYAVSDRAAIAGYGRPRWSVVAGENGSPSQPAAGSPLLQGGEGKAEPGGLGLPMLRRGDRGRTVLMLQADLIVLGYSCGPAGADGDFGPGTYAAVRSFQSELGLGVDGIVGPQTWYAIMIG